MRRQLPIFYSALLLTCVNLLLRVAGTSFQVYISGKIGPEGIGLLQLVMSVNGFALVAGIAGIRTASMYLTAEELGKGKPQNIVWVLSGCVLYSILCSLAVASTLFFLAPKIAMLWIGNGETADALRLFAVFLPAICLCGVMTGYFTAANRIGSLAAVEIAEQLFAMGITVAVLSFQPGNDPAYACQAVVLGSCVGSCLTVLFLLLLRLREKAPEGIPISVRKRILDAAVPLAAADVLKSGISTTENLMVPKRLARNTMTENPLAAFGLVCGMVFPILMFPACILFGLAELLIPELARCNAAGSKGRISYLVRQSLRVALLYGIFFCGLEYLLAEELCMTLYDNADAGKYLRLYALLIPMLYCDAITDAMTKGLGQQKICVRYNILTSGLDVIFLFLLLPRYGMAGYFFSFLVTHLLNFFLSLRRLMKITGERFSFSTPVFAVSACLAAVAGASGFSGAPGKSIVYTLLLCSLLCLFRVTGWTDIVWLSGLVHKK